LIRSVLKSLLILVIFVPVATALPLAAMSLCRTPGRRDGVLLYRPVVVLFLSADLFDIQRHPVALGRRGCASASRSARRSARRQLEGDRVDVRRSLPQLRCLVPSALPWARSSPRQDVAPGRDLFAIGVRLALEATIRRMTPQLLAELIAIHSSCVHDQEGRCPLLVSVNSLCWDDQLGARCRQRGGRRVQVGIPRCALRDRLVEERFDGNVRHDHPDVRSSLTARRR